MVKVAVFVADASLKISGIDRDGRGLDVGDWTISMVCVNLQDKRE